MSKQQTIRSFFQRSEPSIKKRPSGDDRCMKSDVSTEQTKEADSTIENTSPNKDPNCESSSVERKEGFPANNKKPKLDKSTEHKHKYNILPETTTERPHTAQIQKQIAQYTIELSGTLSSDIGCTWFEALEEEFTKPYFKSLDGFLQKV